MFLNQSRFRAFLPGCTSEGVCPQQMCCISVERWLCEFQKKWSILLSYQFCVVSMIRHRIHTKCCPPPASVSSELGDGVQTCSCSFQQRAAEMFRPLAGHFDFHIKLVAYRATSDERQTSVVSADTVWTQIIAALCNVFDWGSRRIRTVVGYQHK